MRRPAVFLRGAWSMAAIRARLPVLLSGAGAAARPRHRRQRARLMPSPALIFHEWDRHGTCSGLSPHAYFEAVRKARAAVKIPADFIELDKPVTVKPDDVAEAVVKANPGLSRAQLA